MSWRVGNLQKNSVSSKTDLLAIQIATVPFSAAPFYVSAKWLGNPLLAGIAKPQAAVGGISRAFVAGRCRVGYGLLNDRPFDDQIPETSKMPYLIGTDEAGYGPNLGPLLISATVWWVDGAANDLYARLGETIVKRPKEAGPKRVAMADSKVLYSSGKGLRHLERGLFAALGMIDRRPRDWDAVWAALDPESAHDRRELPWHGGCPICEKPIPIDADAAELAALEASLRKTMAATGARLIDIRSRAVFPGRFNRLVEESGSKGTVLSDLTLDLLAKAVRPLGDGSLESGPIKIVCDKHGGRNKYAPLLARHFPDWPIEVGEEGRYESRYQFGPSRRRIDIAFQAKGESWLPAALASMASKYLRELAMQAFNDFWCSRLEGLKPTAGYPVDAKRFKAEIAELQRELGIEERLLWRSR